MSQGKGASLFTHQSNALAILERDLLSASVVSSQDRHGLARLCDERGGLVEGLGQVALDVRVQAVLVLLRFHLHHLSLDQVLQRSANELCDVAVPKAGESHGRAREQEVA